MLRRDPDEASSSRLGIHRSFELCGIAIATTAACCVGAIAAAGLATAIIVPLALAAGAVLGGVAIVGAFLWVGVHFLGLLSPLS